MRTISVDDIDVACLEEGDGPAVVMVHGFPDGPWTFDHMAAALAEEGFRVVRPWLRGYPPTTVPPDRSTSLPRLVADLHGLVTALDLRDPILVGHDWGAAIGWAATTTVGHPWRAFVALAVPPPPVQAAAALDPVQALYRAGYMWWLQIPGIERLLPRLVPRLYRRWSPGWTPPQDHLDRVIAMVRRPGAARAMAAYYRWLVPAVLTGRHPADRRALPDVPVRYLHGGSDTCFPATAARRARRHLPTGTVRVLARSGHFLHLERPEAVTADVVRFVHAVRSAGSPP